MALGYEGLIKIDIYTALGTGSAVPRSRARLESSSGYGGQIKDDTTPGDYSKIGIGAPYNYDWTSYDGSLNFELDKAVFQGALKPWLFDRQSSKTVLIRSRYGNVQQYAAYWNSISIGASDGAACDGSVAFVALVPSASYVWGSDYISNKKGYSLFCPSPAMGVPPPLNKSTMKNQYPVPFWNTQVWVTPAGGSASKHNFITWNVTFSQEIVKFFGCTQIAATPADLGALEPLYLAAGPMTVIFSGSYMEDFPGSNAFLGDILDELDVYVDSVPIRLKRLELNTESDDVQTGVSLVPLTVEYVAYELDSAA